MINIDQIDDSILETEYQTTRNLLDYYEKMLYMEAYTDTSFIVLEDGEAVPENPQPQQNPSEKPASNPGNNESVKKQGILSKIWAGIKKIARLILNAIKKIINSIKKHFSTTEKVNKIIRTASKEELLEFKKALEEELSNKNKSQQAEPVTTEGYYTEDIGVGDVQDFIDIGTTAIANARGGSGIDDPSKYVTTGGRIGSHVLGSMASDLSKSMLEKLTFGIGVKPLTKSFWIIPAMTPQSIIIGLSCFAIDRVATNVLTSTVEHIDTAMQEKNPDLPNMDQILKAGEYISKNMISINDDLTKLSSANPRTAQKIVYQLFLMALGFMGLGKDKTTAEKIWINRTNIFGKKIIKVKAKFDNIIKQQASGANSTNQSSNSDVFFNSLGESEYRLFLDAYSTFLTIKGNELNLMLSELEQRFTSFDTIITDEKIEKSILLYQSDNAIKKLVSKSAEIVSEPIMVFTNLVDTYKQFFDSITISFRISHDIAVCLQLSAYELLGKMNRSKELRKTRKNNIRNEGITKKTSRYTVDGAEMGTSDPRLKVKGYSANDFMSSQASY